MLWESCCKSYFFLKEFLKILIHLRENMEMCFHSNQHPSSIKLPFICLYSKYQSVMFTCFRDMTWTTLHQNITKRIRTRALGALTGVSCAPLTTFLRIIKNQSQPLTKSNSIDTNQQQEKPIIFSYS